MLVRKFDAKPFAKRCFNKACSKRATYATVYQDNVFSPCCWCETCDPSRSGASRGKLQAVSGYREALEHVDVYGGRRDDYKQIILEIARAKGLPSRVGDTQAHEFFYKAAAAA